MYIEDDIEDVELLDHVFQELGIDIGLIHLPDGEKALDYLEHAKSLNRLPELILLDINMSKLNGKETFVCLQADKMFARIPKMVLSTSNLESDLNYFKKYMVPYINKPGDVNRFRDELAVKLQDLLRFDYDFRNRIG